MEAFTLTEYNIHVKLMVLPEVSPSHDSKHKETTSSHAIFKNYILCSLRTIS